MDLIETTRHIGKNIKEARRLRSSKHSLLDVYERNWIDSVIHDTEEALKNVAQSSQPPQHGRAGTLGRIDHEFIQKAAWVFKSGPKSRDSYVRLSTCHQSLTAAVACLFSKTAANTGPLQKVTQNAGELPYDSQPGQLLNWRNRHKKRRSSVSCHAETDTGSANTSSIRSSPVDYHASQPEISHVRLLPNDLSHADMVLVPGSSDREKSTRSTVEEPSPKLSDSRRNLSTQPSNDLLECEGTSNRPRALSLPARQVSEKAVVPNLHYPMSPSDYETGSWRAAAVKVCRSPLRNNYTEVDVSDSQLEKQEIDSARTSQRASRSGLLGPNSARSNLLRLSGHHSIRAGPDEDVYEGADGLQLVEDTQSMHLPYRVPLFSNSTVSLCTSTISLPEDPYQANQSPSHDAPKFLMDLDHDKKHSDADLEIPAIESKSPPVNDTSDHLAIPTKECEIFKERGMRSNEHRSRRKTSSRRWLTYHAAQNGAVVCGGF
ncbi:hypothetical protein ACLMJK_001690 [Lecanora helva]